MAKEKVLVVDDDPDFVEVMRLTLEPHGYEVVSAASGDEGLAKVKSERPDLVILDVIMSSVLDGLNMSQRMQQIPEQLQLFARLPAIRKDAPQPGLKPHRQLLHEQSDQPF